MKLSEESKAKDQNTSPLQMYTVQVNGFQTAFIPSGTKFRHPTKGHRASLQHTANLSRLHPRSAVRGPQTLVRHFRILMRCLRQKLLCATSADVPQDGLSAQLPLYPQSQLGDQHLQSQTQLTSLLHQVLLVQERSSDTYTEWVCP